VLQQGIADGTHNRCRSSTSRTVGAVVADLALGARRGDVDMRTDSIDDCGSP
jgi:hypothetical protein